MNSSSIFRWRIWRILYSVGPLSMTWTKGNYTLLKRRSFYRWMMTRTSCSSGTEPSDVICLPFRKNVSLVEHEIFCELTQSVYSCLKISWHGSFVFQKDIAVWHSRSPLSASLAAKFTDCNKTKEISGWTNFATNNALCLWQEEGRPEHG